MPKAGMIPHDELRRIKKRVGAEEFDKHAGAETSFYVKRLDPEDVKARLPLGGRQLRSHEAVLRLAEWVHNEIGWRVKPEDERRTESAALTILLGNGNCNDKAGLLAAFCKAAGLPAGVTGVSHSRTLVRMPENDIEVEFFPSNYMITTMEGQWEIGRDGGADYIRFREPQHHSLYQYHEHDDVFGKKFKEPINVALQRMHRAKYSDLFQDWDKRKVLKKIAVEESHKVKK